MWQEPADTECRPRHIFCFPMCYDVPAARARFYYLLAFMVATVLLFFAARWIATTNHLGEHFSVLLHLFPILIILVAHIMFIGLKYEDLSDRDPAHNIDQSMLRIIGATSFVILGLCVAFSITSSTWWSDGISEHDYVYGAAPEHASPSPAPKSSSPFGHLFGSPSPTPSQTPSSSPDPRIREKEWQQLSSHKGAVGGVYMFSAFSAAGTVVANYFLRVTPTYY